MLMASQMVAVALLIGGTTRALVATVWGSGDAYQKALALAGGMIRPVLWFWIVTQAGLWR